MRRRSSGAIALGIAALVASWGFGSTPLTVLGLGFVLAGVFSRTWARAAGSSVALERRVLQGDRIEGDDVVIEVRASHHRRLRGASIEVRQRLGGIEQRARVRRSRTVLIFPSLPRGRHALEPLDVTLTDPLVLERIEEQVAERSSVLIRPRIPALTSVFSTHGARDLGAARSRSRRATGFEIHAIRDYTPGEPLRAVHWPSTARRGRLMVKELDDAPLDDLAVILDQDPDGVAGPAGSSSFDGAVRAAGAIALAHVLWNRRVVLIGTAPAAEAVPVRSPGHDWGVALDALAEVTTIAGARVDRALRTPVGAISRAREIVVVTGLPERAVEPLLELRRGGRSVALVVLAAETFAGRARDRRHPALLRAVAQGVPVAVVSADSPLEDALAGRLLGGVGA